MISVLSQFQEHGTLLSSIQKDNGLLSQIELISQACIVAYKKGNKTLFAGNGGSAADSQHLAAEFVGKFNFHRDGLPSLALTTNTSIITALANDFEYDFVFARQIKTFGKSGDVFFGISTSGNSKVVNRAMELARKMDIVTIGMTGFDGGSMAELCDYCIKVPSESTPRIQEMHILIGHIICSIVEKALFSKG